MKLWLIPLAPDDQHLVGGGLEGEAEAEQAVEGGGGRAPAVEPEHELVEPRVRLAGPAPGARLGGAFPSSPGSGSPARGQGPAWRCFSRRPWYTPKAHRFAFAKTRWIQGSTRWAGASPTTVGSCLTSLSLA